MTSHLAGDAHCWYQPWFKAHYRYRKITGDFDLAAWKAAHDRAVNIRATQLRDAGWAVNVEDQNAFKLFGKSAILAGKCDLIAIRDDETLIVDIKTGKQRESDWWQVLIYLFAVPRVWPNLPPLRGEVSYTDSPVLIRREELTRERRDRIVAVLQMIGASNSPAATASAAGCSSCDISKNDCQSRIDADVQNAVVEDF